MMDNPFYSSILKKASRNEELKETLIDKDTSTTIQNIAEQGTLKYNQISKILASLDKKLPTLESRNANDSIRKAAKEEINSCSVELGNYRAILSSLANVNVQSVSDRGLKDAQFSQQKAQLQELQTKVQIFIEKFRKTENQYQNSRSPNNDNSSYSQNPLGQSVSTMESSKQSMQSRVQDQIHEERLINERNHNIKETTTQVVQLVGMMQNLNEKVVEQGAVIVQMKEYAEDTKVVTQQTTDVMVDTNKLQGSTTNSTLHLCLLISVIVIIILLMVSSGGSNNDNSNTNNGNPTTSATKNAEISKLWMSMH